MLGRDDGEVWSFGFGDRVVEIPYEPETWCEMDGHSMNKRLTNVISNSKIKVSGCLPLFLYIISMRRL